MLWPLVLVAYTEVGKRCIRKQSTKKMREQMRRQE